jgi:hypothetical protein
MHLMRPVDYSCYAGAGAFVSTPSDLVRFGMAMHGGMLLQPATVELLQTSQRLASGEQTVTAPAGASRLSSWLVNRRA